MKCRILLFILVITWINMIYCSYKSKSNTVMSFMNQLLNKKNSIQRHQNEEQENDSLDGQENHSQNPRKKNSNHRSLFLSKNKLDELNNSPPASLQFPLTKSNGQVPGAEGFDSVPDNYNTYSPSNNNASSNSNFKKRIKRSRTQSKISPIEEIKKEKEILKILKKSPRTVKDAKYKKKILKKLQRLAKKQKKQGHKKWNKHSVNRKEKGLNKHRKNQHQRKKHKPTKAEKRVKKNKTAKKKKSSKKGHPKPIQVNVQPEAKENDKENTSEDNVRNEPAAKNKSEAQLDESQDLPPSFRPPTSEKDSIPNPTIKKNIRSGSRKKAPHKEKTKKRKIKQHHKKSQRNVKDFEIKQLKKRVKFLSKMNKELMTQVGNCSGNIKSKGKALSGQIASFIQKVDRKIDLLKKKKGFHGGKYERDMSKVDGVVNGLEDKMMMLEKKMSYQDFNSGYDDEEDSLDEEFD